MSQKDLLIECMLWGFAIAAIIWVAMEGAVILL